MEKNYLAIYGDDNGVKAAQLALTRTCAIDMLWDYVIDYHEAESIETSPEICKINFEKTFNTKAEFNSIFLIYKDDGYTFFQVFRLGD